MFILKVAALAFVIAIAAGSPFAALPKDAVPDESSPITLKLRATLYTVALESDFPSSDEAAFLARNGEVLYRASRKFLADAALQGSAQLNDGRIVMLARRVKSVLRWKVSPEPHAIGASGCALLPFRSAAVDKRVIPLGTKLIIPETQGLALPDGTVHDGVWYAMDTGAAIKRDRVDLFVGSGKAPLTVLQGIRYLQKLTVKLAGQMPSCPA
jgi:3D (Asp-Asp-Asp) domain-containing protein